MKKNKSKLPIIELLILAIIFMSVSSLVYFHMFESIEVKTHDARLNYVKTNDVYDKIVIVTIDDEDLAEIGEWPWPRGIHGKLIDKLKNAGAKVIGFDVFFSMNSTNKEEDNRLVESVKKAGNVITARDI